MSRASGRLIPVLLASAVGVAACQGASAPTPVLTPLSTAQPTLSAQPTPTASSRPSALSDALVLVALGDSIASFADDGPETYPELLADLIKASTGREVTVANFADGSNTSTTLLAAIKTDQAVRQALGGADVVTITVGGNDGDPFATHPAGTCAPGTSTQACLTAYAPDVESNLRSILQQIAALTAGHPTAVRVTSPDYNAFIGWDEAPSESFGLDFYRQVAAALTEAACRAAAANGVPCVDFYHTFNGAQGTTDAGRLLAEDHAHPSAAGRAEIAQQIADLGLGELGLMP